MPLIKSSVFKRYAKLVSTIISLSEIMPFYSRYVERKQLYVIITAPLGRQPSSYTECSWVNIQSSYNICLVFNAKRIFPAYCCS